MKVNGKYYNTVWFENGDVFLIDQNKLPYSFSIHRCFDYKETTDSIYKMTVRGAGAIGVTGAFAMAQAFIKNEGQDIYKIRDFIKNIRPTAYNLSYSVDKVFNEGLKGTEKAIAEAHRLANENIESCKAIGNHGLNLMHKNIRIQTHCNAGWLAFVDYGSALAPVYVAKEKGLNPFVFVDETRPRNQGAKLTSWELLNEEIPHSIIADSSGAYFMSKGEIDIVITGADRIAKNGDTANKIGTLDRAILAKHFGIPFYIAAPLSTFDFTINSGNDIIIENRDEKELLQIEGVDNNNELKNIRITPENSKAINPSFDVTPAELITGIITEKGIIKACEKDITKLLTR